MRKPPFHRRVLPWIFVITFLAMAPAVIFYTSGYRYDTKKGKVERNGTVIIDSIPTGATIQVDGRGISQTTPYTVQDEPPGTHNFSLAKTGYHPWEKNLDVRPELVTFADNIHLWRDGAPVFEFATAASQLFMSPDGKHLVSLENATSSKIISYPVTTAGPLGAPSTFALKEAALDKTFPVWSTNARMVLLENPLLGSEASWVFNTANAQAPTKLPLGVYRWSGRLLDGMDGSKTIEFDTNDNSLTRTALPQGSMDQFEGYRIRTATGTQQLVLVTPDKPDEGFILPYGNWVIWTIDKKFVLLRDGDQWLSLVFTGDQVESHAARGTQAFPINDGKRNLLLLVDSTGIWSWDPTTEAELLYRQSEPLVQAVWHPAGHDVFFATQTSVFAQELDARDGRTLTQLASFDHIRDIAATDKLLYVLGTSQGKTGMWRLALE